MRRVVTLALLLGGMQLVLPLGSQGGGAETLLFFGFLILAAYMVGEIATAWGLPKIVGYLVAGALFGPHVLGIVPEQATERLAPVSELAVALIAFLAGAELRWADVREGGVALTKIMTADLSISFVTITSLLFAMQGLVPAWEGYPLTETLVMCILFASVAIVHSPAVTIALLSETKAKGPVARTTLGVVLLTDVAVILLFTGALTLARSVAPSDTSANVVSLGLVVWEIAGAVLIGAAIGAAVALYLRFVGKELVLFAVLVALFGMEIARVAHVELLITLLMAGFIAENATPYGDDLRHAMERSAAPIFVVFFALSGAKIRIAEVAPQLPLVIPIALARVGAIWLGVRVGTRWAGKAPAPPEQVWKGLVSQAGVAIGLATILAEAYPDRGTLLAGMLLALIAVNETIGPILFRNALTTSGEVVSETEHAGERPVGEHA